MEIGDSVEILYGNIIKGQISIGANSRIESGVNMTGSDDFPLKVGKNVLIKGTSYIFGSIVEDDVYIERSVIIKKVVRRIQKEDGYVQPIRFYLPPTEGLDAVNDI
jgi:bifunctional UDP-N-acetylglucosamine pyrophosphorylase/glucosamine-1-phosphate N-acetyltransferase